MDGALAAGQGTGLTGDEVLGSLFKFGETWASDKYLSNRESGSTRDPAPVAPAPGRDATLVAKDGPGPKVSIMGIGASIGAALVLGLLVYFVTKNAGWALLAAALAAVVVAYFMAQG
jgi:hypothetical protein